MNLRRALARAEPFGDVEADIAEALARTPPMRQFSQPADYAPPAIRNPPMPTYVEHQEGVNDVGRLSAEAMVREYEAAATAVETMGAELIERVRSCERMVAQSMLVVDEMKATAARYREEAKRVFRLIEDCSMLTDEVRRTCGELTAKIVRPTQAE